MQALHEIMPPGSSIVNVGSSIAFTGYPAVAETATMWALRGLTHAANLELGGRGIRVNAVHPGFLADQADSLRPGFADVALSLTTLTGSPAPMTSRPSSRSFFPTRAATSPVPTFRSTEARRATPEPSSPDQA